MRSCVCSFGRIIVYGSRLRFGIFLAPFHKPGINPTLSLQNDLELIQWLDRCGLRRSLDRRAPFGRLETIASPEIFIAAAAERTTHIKLGTGVVSLSYHNPCGWRSGS